MSADNNGFLYPYINNEVCVNCGACEKGCPVLNKTKQINNISPYLDKRGAVIKIFADDIPSIEMHQIKGHQNWFRKIFNAELTVELANEEK